MGQPNLEEDRHVAIHRDAIGSAITFDDGNQVSIYSYQLDCSAVVAADLFPSNPSNLGGCSEAVGKCN